MDQKELIFGVGSLLRERVEGWSTTDDGTSHVYPDHPPLSLSSGSYPRATVDTIGHNPTQTDIERTVFTGEVLLEVTTYAVNSGEVNEMHGRVVSAVISHHQDNHQEGEDAGSPYLENWSFDDIGLTGPLVDEDTDKGFTRYSKIQEFQFTHVTTS